MRNIILVTLLIIIIPCIIINLFVRTDEIKFHYISNQIVRVKDEKTEKIYEVPLEEYVKGVIAGEMPTDFEIEALKAQAVASRSYVLVKMHQNQHQNYDVVNTVSNQVYLTDEQLEKKWGNQYLKKINKIKKAVLETKGEYLSYDGKVVEALFFSTSCGKTENSEEVFSSKIPYLRSVSSVWDEASPVYEDSIAINLKKFYEKINLDYQPQIKYEILETTSTGRIKKLLINGKEFDGREFAKKLSFRSNYFNIIQNNENVTIITKGFGHGVGMSQYGALGMAKEGYNYKEILKHYYLNTEIKKF